MGELASHWAELTKGHGPSYGQLYASLERLATFGVALRKVSQDIARSKLWKRDPERFNLLMGEILSEAGCDRLVWLTGDDLTDCYEKFGDPGKLNAAGFVEVTRGDGGLLFSSPIFSVLQAVAATDDWNILVRYIRFSPTALSLEEVDSFRFALVTAASLWRSPANFKKEWIMSKTIDGDLPEYESEQDIAARTGTSAKFWRALRQKGGGPTYVKLSSRTVRYRRLDVDAWLEARKRSSTFDG